MTPRLDEYLLILALGVTVAIGFTVNLIWT
jgi:hypothetical protein